MIQLNAGSIALLAAAGFLASGVNAIAGGGSLISFPALLVAGYPALVANVTNTLGLIPGYASSTGTSRDLLAGQRSRILVLAPVGVAGSLLGAFLLTRTPASSFRVFVPWLILLACALLGLQPLFTRRRSAGAKRDDRLPAAMTTQFFGGMYGGFFGAGLGVMLLATLGLFLDDTLPHVNALKQFLSLLIAIAAAVWFAAFGPVAWAAVAPLALGSLLGGIAGVLVARRLRPQVLRTVVVVFGVSIAIRLLL
jgi:uncharacterized membrane protein YfcA